MIRWMPVLLLAVAAVAVLSADAPARPVTLLVGGLTQDTIEPCGCGGRTAGGLARRAAVTRALRRQWPELVSIDAGSFGLQAHKFPTTLRSLAYLGVDLCALDDADLQQHERLLPPLADHALRYTSLAPPDAELPEPLPKSAVIGPTHGPRIGVVAISYTVLSIHDLTKQTAAEFGRLREDERIDLAVLISHIGAPDTARLLTAVAPADRPALVVYATSSAMPPEPVVDGDTLWVGLARQGRSVALIQGEPVDGRYRLTGRAITLEPGELDSTVAGWVKAYYDQMRAGEVATNLADKPASFPPVSACADCHAETVAAWRQHPHAHAVETLEAVGRDVSACLTCHSERLRRDGVRPAADGDRGIVCATCHRGLTSHMAQPRRAKATSIAVDDCLACHTEENSQNWDVAAYWANVLGACGGEPQARVHPVP